MEKQDKIISAVLGLGIAYFAFRFIVRNADSNKVAKSEKKNPKLNPNLIGYNPELMKELESKLKK